MNKKVLAVALATLMILGILPALVPMATAAKVNYTTRTPAPDPRDPVVNGTCAQYQSENAIAPARTALPIPPMCVFLHPGVADTYKTGWSHTLDTLWGMQSSPTPGQPMSNGQTRQVFDKYLDYAILASSSDSIGDFQFDISILPLADTTKAVTGITIYLPPEFRWLAPSKKEAVWTDITNDYDSIAITTRNEYDTVAPHWNRIVINGVVIPSGVYHVRIFNLAAPSVVGLYHFKIFYETTVVSTWTTTTYSLGAGNFPIMIVKGELNPAYVEVTVRADDYTKLNDALVSGMITATGTTPTGRTITGKAYWGPADFVGDQPVPPGPAGALYRAYLFGLPAGTYQIVAEASGFKATTSERFTLDAGQSFAIRIVIFQSPLVSVTVWSKHGTGAIPWHNLWQLPYGTNCPSCPINDKVPRRDIFFNLYDSKGTMVGYWGTDDQNTNTFTSKVGSKQRQIPLNNLLNYYNGLGDGLIPSATNEHFQLTDNFDLLFAQRGLTSTNWEGHVPWDIPDYVQGMVEGQYTVEAYVTGYILDEADAYQRSLTISNIGPGTQYELQMDLRRSNWIEQIIHLPSSQLSPTDVTISLTATDKNNTERGSVALIAYQAADGNANPLLNGAALDGVIDGQDAVATGETPYWAFYNGGIIIEGWNDLFPNAGAYGVAEHSRSTSGTINDNHKDYGLNPTASSHSDQAVMKRVKLAGNPYTVHLYMADMGDPSGFIESDGLFQGTPIAGTGWYNIVGGDPQVSVFLCNSPASLSYAVVNASAWISLRSVDFEVPAHSRPWTFPGAPISVDFMDAKTNAVIDSLDPEIYGLFQDPGQLTNEAYPGYTIPGASQLVVTGVCTKEPYGYTPFDVDNLHCAGQHEHIGVRYYGTDQVAPSYGGDAALYKALLPATRSTRLPAGEYTYAAYTYGYIMRRAFPMFIPNFGEADIEADMIQGAQLRVELEFFNEAVQTNFNGWIAVEVFNDKGLLVGASIYGQAQPNCFTRRADALDQCTGTYLEYEGDEDWQIVGGPSQGTGLDATPYTYVYPNAGAPQAAPGSAVFPSNSYGQRAEASMETYGIPAETWAFYDETNPSEANRVNVPAGQMADVDVFGFYNYKGSAYRTWAGGWPANNGTTQNDSGIKGSVDIPGWAGSGGGLYSVKVWAFDPFGPNNQFEAANPSDDWRMYSMAMAINGIQLPWGGAQEIHVNMNNMAKLQGTVRWFDMYGTLRPLAWAQITATGPALTSPAAGYPAYSSGYGSVGAGASDSAGAYLMFLPAGSHDVSISTSQSPQIWSSAAPTFNTKYTAVVSPGWVGGGDTSLAGSGTPVPEVPAYLLPLTLIAALGASVFLLRKKATTNLPVLMK